MDKVMTANLGYRPPPPPLPKYDPTEEAPKWSWYRINCGLPVDKGTKAWTPIGTQPKSSQDPDWRGVIRDNVVQYPVVEPYKFGWALRTNYFWFDTPDYADPFKKLGYSFKFFAVTGLVGCLVRGGIESKHFTVQNHIFLFRKVWVPWVVAGMAASATVVTLANLRGKKDDLWNYAAAGLMFACPLGHKNSITWFKWTVATVPLALVVKHNAEINGQLWPTTSWARLNTIMLGNNTGEDGFFSGDLRFGFRRNKYGDPGRDQR